MFLMTKDRAGTHRSSGVQYRSTLGLRRQRSTRPHYTSMHVTAEDRGFRTVAQWPLQTRCRHATQYTRGTPWMPVVPGLPIHSGQNLPRYRCALTSIGRSGGEVVGAQPEFEGEQLPHLAALPGQPLALAAQPV